MLPNVDQALVDLRALAAASLEAAFKDAFEALDAHLTEGFRKPHVWHRWRR